MSEQNDSTDQDNVYFVEDGSITLKERFRSTHLLRFKDQAPDLAETFLEFFKDQVDFGEDVDEMNDEELESYLADKEEEQAQKSFQKMVEGSMQLTMEISIDELEALHRLCINLIKRVDDLEDEETRTDGVGPQGFTKDV